MRKTYRDMVECGCDSANTLAIIGGKWKILILYHLSMGTKRFNELGRLLPAVSAHTLSKDLLEMQEDGLIIKIKYDVIPPKTEYKLSEKGKELKTLLNEIKKFGGKYKA